MILRALVVVAASLVLTGCLGGGNAPIRYYLVDPVALTALEPQPDLALEVLDVRIPQYLDRFSLVRRIDDGRLSWSADHQWSEPLRKNLMRVLGRNLSAALGTVDVATPLTRSTSMPDYRLQVFIESFEQDVDGSVQLVARWQISDGETSRALAIAEDRFERRGLAPGDHAAVVAAMRELYGELAEAIARSVLLQARQA